MIKKKFRIKKIKEFGYMFKRGERAGVGALGLIWTKSYLPYSRLGISIGTKCGNAVERNKIKRRLRAIYAELDKSGAVPKKKNFIFVCKVGLKEWDYQKMRDVCIKLMKKVQNECV